MAPDQDPPARPRRERPLVAPGRETPAEPPPPPTPTTPPVGRPVVEFASTTGTPEREDRVHVWFEGPTPQRRWTVALRIILAVPHFIWGYLLGIAGGVVAVISWFAALFTGRVPTGLASFQRRVVQYQARLLGYSSLLLTDKYPPFELDTDYAINVATNPGELNRAAVFFRPILMVPSGIVSTVAYIGAQALSVVGWLLTLILGRLPTPMWEANAAVLRYYTRAQAFAFMLTAEQPSGLFGDKGDGPPSVAVVDASDMPNLPASPRISRLKLSQAARRIIVLYIVFAVVTYVGFFTFAAFTVGKTVEALNDLRDSHERLGVSVSAFGADSQRCAIEGGAPCQHEADLTLADAFDRFADEVSAISFPANLDVSVLIADAHDCSAALRRMAASESAEANAAAFEDYQRALQTYLDDYAEFDYEAEYST